MKKQLLSIFVIMALLFANVPAALADSGIAAEAQIVTLPVVTKGASATAAAEVSLLSTQDTATYLTVNSAYTDDFYADAAVSDIFHITVDFLEAKDARENLKLDLVDENNTVVATQKSAYYLYDNSVNYQMQLTGSIDSEGTYSVRFTYTGSHELQYETSAVEIWPIADVAIQHAEVIDPAANSHKLTLANAAPGVTFSLCYVSYWQQSQEIWVDAATDASGCIYVEFGGTLDPYSTIYLCEEGTDRYYNSLSEVEVDLYGTGAGGNIRDYGASMSDYIAADSSTVWIYLYEKAFGYAPYSEADAENISAYLFDLTAKKNVNATFTKEYVSEYSEIEGCFTLNEKLDTAHKYMVVVNDGYTVRILDDFEVTAESMITHAYFYVNESDTYSTQGEQLPAGLTDFYTCLSMVNIPTANRSAVTVEILDESGSAVATSTYTGTSNKYRTRADKAIEPGKYTLKATYNDIVFTAPLTFHEGTPVFQLGNSAIVYNGKAYITARIQSEDYAPEALNYKLEMPDGSQLSGSFHRSLYTEGRDRYFVVVFEDTLESVSGSNRATLRMYDGDTLIPPAYENNMRVYVNKRTDMPFVYNQVQETDNTFVFFIEGVEASNPTFTLCAYDDLSQSGKSVPLTYSSSAKTLSAAKTALSAITTEYPIERETLYGDDKNFFIEMNNEYLTDIYTQAGNITLNDEFSFAKTATTIPYAVLNLPFMTYDYYKLAKTEGGLSSASWTAMTNGLIYELEAAEGAQTVYAKFKTASGTESTVRRLSILLDNSAPTLAVSFDETATYYIDDDNQVQFPLSVTASEAGSLWYAFYDKDGNLIGYDGYRQVAEGTQDITLYAYADNYDYTAAETITFYLEDAAGNLSTKYTFDVNIEEKLYITEPISGGSIYFDASEGRILEVSTTETAVELPSEIGGYDVVAIEEYAFYDNCDNLQTITVPESVTDIARWAFAGVSVTLQVYPGSYAASFAETNYISYEYIAGIGIQTCTRTGTSLYAEAQCVSEDTISGTVIFALYDNRGRLKATQAVAAVQNPSATLSNAAAGDTLKVMWWNDLSTMVAKGTAKKQIVE